MKTLSLLLSLCLINSVSGFSQAGALDLTFSSDGVAVYNSGPGTLDNAGAIAMQADGKILVGGFTTDVNENYELLLVRLKTNGSTDLVIVSDLGNVYETITSLAVQPDGKIIVGAYSADSSFTLTPAILRYNPNGFPDATFGTGGMLEIPAGTMIGFAGAVLQADGKILVTGSTDLSLDDDIIMMRFNADGSTDNSFGVSGMVITSIPNSDEYVYQTTLQPDGKIVMIAQTSDYITGYSDILVARYLTTGAVDSSFSADGFTTVNISNTDFPGRVAVQADGKIVVSGASEIIQYEMGLMRFNANGDPDATFDNDGIANTGIMLIEPYVALAIQPDGKILTTATVENVTDNDLLLARFNADGSADASFDSDGVIQTDLGDFEFASAIALQSDGKMVVTGYSGSAGNEDIVTLRFLDGTSTGIENTAEFTSQVAIFPNPVTEYTTLEYTLSEGGIIQIGIYDELGRQVMQVVADERREKGLNREYIQIGDKLLQGIYQVVITAGTEIKGKQMVVHHP